MKHIERVTRLLVVCFCCCVSLLAHAQQKTTGTVISKTDNTALQGATVSVKGTTAVTKTDDNGNFSIQASTGQVLIISYAGFSTKEILISALSLGSIELIAVNGDLGEVVVIGYGTQRKTQLTGAVSRISGAALENRPVTNAVAALQGAAPGLIITRSNGQPGKEGWSATIRGFSSVNGTNTPLVIIDGVPGTQATLSTLNPNDIESISVLKDAAAAAIYGADAAGGVLIITTKTGKGKKLRVDYNSIYTSNHAFNMPERNHSWIEAEQLNLARRNSGQSDSWSAAQIRWFKSADTNYLPNPTNPAAWDAYEDIDYTKLLLRNSTFSQQQYISASGGNDKTDYLFSVGYYNQNGVFKFGPDETKRINARLNLNVKLTNKVSLSSRIGYSNIKTLSPALGTSAGSVGGDFGLIYQLYQLRTIYPIFLPKSDGSTAGSYDETKYFSGGIQTYAVLKDGGRREEINNRLDAAFILKAYNLVKGLSLRAIYNPQLYILSDNNILKTIEYWDRQKVASYSNQANSITKARAITTRNDIQFLADYDYKIKLHNFHLLAGYQYNELRGDTISARANNLISNDVFSLNISSNPAVNLPAVGDGVGVKVLISGFGRLNYDFDGKYLFEATLRKDASSQLAPGKKGQFFPSVSAGWNIHKEDWFANALPVFNEVKLRASWGKLGNSNTLGYYDYLALLVRGGIYPFNNAPNNSIFQAAYASTEKSWESLVTTNMGMDLQLLKRRLSASFDYFVRRNNNMLIVPTLPAIFGIIPAQRNDADMKSWGWEIDLKWKDKIGTVNYWVNFNIADAKNKIVKYNGNNVYSPGINGIIEGLPVNTIWGYKTLGYFQTAAEVTAAPFQDSRAGAGDVRYVDMNKDNRINGGINTLIDHGDLVNLGETTPHYTFGSAVGLEWKGLDFSILFQGVLKRKMLIFTNAVLPYMESWRQAWVINNDYWTPENPNAKFPRPFLGGTHNALVSDKWVQNAAYIRLKNLQVGYTIPLKLTQKLNISKVRIYFSGQDLWEKTGMWYKYYDAEQPNTALFDYPFFRSYAFGLNVTF